MEMDERRQRILAIGIAVAILVGAVLSICVADLRARQSARERAEKVLVDSAREQAQTFASALGARLRLLGGLSAYISAQSDARGLPPEDILKSFSDTADFGFTAFNIAMPDGRLLIQSEDTDISVADRPYFATALNGQAAIERVTGRISGQIGFILAVPYRKDGAVLGVLTGIYNDEGMRTLITSEAYGGKGYSILLSGSGEIIINAENDSQSLPAENIYEVFNDVSFKGPAVRAAMESALKGRKSETFRYRYKGEDRIAVIIPLNNANLPENDWYIFNALQENVLFEEINVNRQDAVEATYVFAAFAAVALGLLVLLEVDFRRKMKRDAQRIRQSEEQFRIVTEQSGKSVIRYDIPTKTGHLSGEKAIADFAETNIRIGRVAPESQTDYRAFFESIGAGKSPVVSDIELLSPNGARSWYRHMSTTIFGEDKTPRTAIISYYDVSDQRERELAYAKWQQEIAEMPFESAALYEWNLTRDIFEGQRGSLAIDADAEGADTFNARSANFIEKYVYPGDRQAFSRLFNREHLLTMYIGKNTRCAMEYRYMTENGTLRWRRLSVQMVPYPDSQDVKAFVINMDIDEQKREALARETRARQDYLTGALNRETFIERVDALLAGGEDAVHAVLMMDVDGFKQINDRLGHDAGDRTLWEVVENARAVLRADDLIGRLGGDEFMICLSHMPGDAAIGKKAEQICTGIRRRLSDDMALSVSIGIAVSPRDGRDFAQLYRCADIALYHAKDNGKDGFAFFQSDMADDIEQGS